jgi:hypothetical protein
VAIITMKFNRLFIGLTALFFGLITAFLLFRGGKLDPDDEGGGDETSMVASQFELTRTALALTENLDSQAAIATWDQLSQQLPNDASVLLNRSLNRVLHVDSLTESTTNALLSADEKQAARRQLPDAIEGARNAIKAYAAASKDKVLTLWLDSRIDLQEASLLPASLSKSLRQEIFDRLATSVEKDLKGQSQLIILGGPLMRVIDELESPINGLPAEVLTKASAATQALSEQVPENLFIALRAARLGIAAKDAKAQAAVERTRELASAIEPSIRPSTQSIGLTPDELVQKILDAIKASDWQTADNQINLWFNVLNGTDLVKTDRRRSAPHPLDRLSFQTLRELSAELVADQAIAPSSAPLQFSSSQEPSGEEVAQAIAVDIDLDLVPDVASISANGVLTLWKNDGKLNWTSKSELDLKMACAGLLSADLFMVDASDPKRLQASAVSSAEGENATTSARHNTFPTLLAFGEGGAKLISIDGRPATEDAARLSEVDGPTGLESVSEVTDAIAGDLEGDGDLDLVMSTKSQGIKIFVNRGNRTFFEPTLANQASSLSKLTSMVSLAMVDLDRDLDLDVLTLDGTTGKTGLLENLLHLQFRHRELAEIPARTGATQLVVADVDGNVSWDIVMGGPSSPTQVVYSTTSDTGVWSVEQTAALESPTGAFLVADFDNDSWQEVLGSKDAQVQVAKLIGKTPESSLVTGSNLRGEFVSATDFDLDGKLDVLTPWMMANGR